MLSNLVRFLSFLVVLTAANILHAQPMAHWHKIAPFPGLPFFWDELHGVLGAANAMYWTSNGGETWNQAVTPSTAGYSYGAASLYMQDTLLGWASEWVTDGSGTFDDQNALWETRDGGRSWSLLSGYKACNYGLKSGAGIVVQNDGGIAFESAMKGLVVGAAPANLNRYHGNARTTDGGATWTPLPPTQALQENWGIYYQQTKGRYYVRGETDTSGAVYYTSDFGDTWVRTKYVNPGYRIATSGDVEGSANAMYLQGSGPASTPAFPGGIWRSEDGFNSLKFVGGPILNAGGADTRFDVPPSCNGGIVVAFGFDPTTHEPGTWMTTDGGDGTLVAVAPPGISIVDTDKTTECHDGTLEVTIKNVQCRGITMDTAWVVEKDFNGTFSLGATSLPIYLDSGRSATIELKYSGLKPFLHSADIHIHGTNDGLFHNPYDTVIHLSEISIGDTGRLAGRATLSMTSPSACSSVDSLLEFVNTGCGPVTITDTRSLAPFALSDTTLPLTIAAGDTLRLHVRYAPSAPGAVQGQVTLLTARGEKHDSVIVKLIATTNATGANVSSKPLDLGSVSLCAARDTVVTLRNVGCDTVRIIDAHLLHGDAFAIGSTHPDITLAPDSAGSLAVHYAPSTAGAHPDTLIVLVSDHGKATYDTIALRATSVAGMLVQLADSASITLSICSTDTLLIPLTNDGCDSVTINASVTGTDFTLLDPHADLAPGAASTIHVRVAPSVRGTRTGSVQLQIVSARTGEVQDTIVPLVAHVRGGDALLAVSTDALDFGTLTACEEPDSVITLTNTGCDTLTIDKDSIGGMFVLDATLPIVLKPGESTTVTVHSVSDTTGHPTTVTGTLQFWSTATNALPPIPLSRGFTYPARLKIEAVTNASGHAGDIVTFRLMLEGNVPKAMSALHFDLTHNDDLLSFLSMSGSGLRLDATTGHEQQTQSFTLSPVADTGIIGELTFQTYLAKAASTELALGNLRFDYPNLTVPPDCIASIDATSANFEYVYNCGEPTIQNWMAGRAPVITSLKLNDGQTQLTLKLTEPSTISIVDILGRVVLRQWADKSATLDLSQLPSGTYYLSATSQTDFQNVPLIIRR